MNDTTMNQTTAFEGIGSQDASQPKAGPGTQLASQREARGWTIEQVATQLNLAPRQIHALETDNFAALPGIASVRGFIRSYAKLLKIEAEPLLAMIVSEPVGALHESVPMRRALSTPFSDNTRLPSLSGHDAPSKSTFAVLLIILLAAGALGAHQMGWIPALPESSPARLEENPVPLPASVPSASASEASATEVQKTVVPEIPNSANDAAATQSTSVYPTNRPATEPVVDKPAAVTVPDNTPTPGKDALVLKLREDSWVEIRRINNSDSNSIVISRLIKAGSTETLAIAEPVSVTIGNASGVELTLRGKPVDLKADARTNVARLNLK